MENKTKDNTSSKQTEILTKKSIIKLISCAGLSLFWVVFIWNFWDKGIYALGLNAFFFLLLFTGLFIWILHKKGRLFKNDLIWIIPLSLIILSFLIYDNPFLKVVSMLVFPVSFTIFYNYAFLDDKKTRHWDFYFFSKTLARIFSFLSKIGESITSYIELMIPAGKTKRKVIVKIISGIILFLIIALTVFIPLLSSADTVFADKMQVIYDWIKEVFSIPVVYKIIIFIIFSVLISSMLFAWGKRFDYEEKEESKKKIDSIVSGIVLGGVLILYLLFLWVQIERLWVGTLPFDFKETENLVKSGFWQLFFLSIINIVIYFFTYRKTNPIVQWVLTGFTATSLLLLSSAGYRMGLYTTYYGFSYEKFFASYTVLYCAILFIWLISRLFIKKRSNIVKFLVLLFLWMYAVITVLPVEQFILRANINLAKLEQSRIRLFELTMLSPDVLLLVKKNKSQGLLKENNNYLAREDSEKTEEQFDWDPWIERQEKKVMDKKWYERNIINSIYLIK